MGPTWLAPLIGFTLFSAVFAALSGWRPNLGRLLGGLLLLAGGVFNAYLGTTHPAAYAAFKPMAVLDLYKTVIDLVFPAFGTPFIVAIALGQILAGTLLLVGGRWLGVGALGGLIFSLAIVPLGIGSAFPAPLLMALAYGLLLWRFAHREPPHGRPV